MTHKYTKIYVPFDIRGNLMHTTHIKIHDTPAQDAIDRCIAPAQWLPNLSFDTTIELKEMKRESSSVFYTAEDANTYVKYFVFPYDLLDIIHNMKIENAQVTGTWFIRKRGTHYGISRYPYK